MALANLLDNAAQTAYMNSNILIWNSSLTSNQVVNKTFSFFPTISTNTDFIGGGASDDGVHCYTNNWMNLILARSYSGVSTPSGNTLGYPMVPAGDAYQLVNLNLNNVRATNVPANGNTLRYTNGNFFWAP